MDGSGDEEAFGLRVLNSVVFVVNLDFCLGASTFAFLIGCGSG